MMCLFVQVTPKECRRYFTLKDTFSFRSSAHSFAMFVDLRSKASAAIEIIARTIFWGQIASVWVFKHAASPPL